MRTASLTCSHYVRPKKNVEQHLWVLSVCVEWEHEASRSQDPGLYIMLITYTVVLNMRVMSYYNDANLVLNLCVN